jgi:Uncharacterized protein conserved in bacteria (DUF2171)
MIRPGWKVYASDGTEVGAVDEVTGDDGADIFDGLAVATSALGQPKYFPAEQIARITEGRIDLSLPREQVEGADAFLEPATSAVIEPDDHRGVGESIGAEARKLEGKAFAPTQRHEHPMNLWRRIAFYFRRLFS